MLKQMIRLLALSVALVSAAGAAPAASVAVVGNCTPEATWGTVNSSYASQVVTLVNNHRTAMGLNALKVSPTLTNAAVWKSRHMAYYGYMQHDDPAPPIARTVSQRLAACGYPSSTSGWGENIAYGYQSPTAVMNGWLNSSGHKANIENSSYRTIGVGVASNSNGTLYWTQDFGTFDDSGLSTSPPPPPPPPPPPVVLAGRTIELAPSSHRIRRGRFVTFNGVIEAFANQSACEVGQQVVLQLRRPTRARFTTFAQRTSAADGSFKASLKPGRTYVYRARVAQSAQCLGAVSERETVTVYVPKKKKKRR
jgi:uncharacterized protein YkwD